MFTVVCRNGGICEAKINNEKLIHVRIVKRLAAGTENQAAFATSHFLLNNAVFIEMLPLHRFFALSCVHVCFYVASAFFFLALICTSKRRGMWK